MNNAAIGIWQDAESMTDEEWRKVMSVNLDGVFFCARAEARVMLKPGYGKIINIASMSGHIVNRPQNQAAYNTSKAGVLHLTRSLAAEWAPTRHLGSTASPGLHAHTGAGRSDGDRRKARQLVPTWMGLTPMGQVLDVTDLQGAVVYLAAEGLPTS